MDRTTGKLSYVFGPKTISVTGFKTQTIGITPLQNISLILALCVFIFGSYFFLSHD